MMKYKYIYANYLHLRNVIISLTKHLPQSFL